MSKFLSTKYSTGAFNFGYACIAVRRRCFISFSHGFDKLIHFSTMKASFYEFYGIGFKQFLLTLAIFAEFFCSIFLILGLFTRLSVIPIIIAMSVALFKVHNGDYFWRRRKSRDYLIGLSQYYFVAPEK